VRSGRFLGACSTIRFHVVPYSCSFVDVECVLSDPNRYLSGCIVIELKLEEVSLSYVGSHRC
jgi:hypothetical protein